MKNNIILIGMPSSGKTTIGKAIAEQINFVFLDTDNEIKKTEERDVAEIIINEGEKAFRNVEEKVIERIAKESDYSVIACGGGVILRENNMIALKKNGVVFYLERNIELLSTEGRPLSKNFNNLVEMKRTRLPLYHKYADYIVNNDSTVQKTVKEIIDKYENYRN